MPSSLAVIPLLVALALGCRSQGSADSVPELPAPGTCAPGAYVPRQIRLLTRSEYDRTVESLLGGGGAQCSGEGVDAACDVDAESCVAGVCTPDPCSLVTFLLPGSAGSTVVVAGEFNGWGATEQAGGWPMAYEPSIGAHVAKRAVPDGSWPYKFVVDGAWIADPGNPSTVDDGYGGVNSVLLQACADAAPSGGPSPSAGFPMESRPTHYPFDNAAESGLVTAVHAELYASAAERLAAEATAPERIGSLLGCDPASAGCTDGWLRSFGRRAFRRPPDEETLARYAALVASAPDPAAGATAALRAMLQSPLFLYRVESGAAATGGYRLDDYEIASVMSYLLWGTTPDDALLDAAAAGHLADPDGREAEARRMLADPRARAAFSRLVVQWLGVEEVPHLTRSSGVYPAWSAALGESMVRETEAFSAWVAFDQGGTFADLLTSDRLVVDPLLAAHYGVSAPTDGGTAVIAAPPERRGLLGQAAFLSANALSDQSSPIKRGVRVFERLLCRQFATPPAVAGGVPEVDPDATTRERFAQHTADPACAACHTIIDPVGFGFEGFDGIGAHRTTDNGLPIDTTGAIALDGGEAEPFDGVPELASLLASSDEARTCFATQVLRQTTGRLEVDRCMVDTVDAAFAASGGDLVELMVSVIRSDAVAWRSE